VAEAIHCPSCSTRYRLRPERVKAAIRRAQCFTCGGLFPLGDLAQRLLALPLPSQVPEFEIESLKAGPKAGFEAEFEPLAELEPLSLPAPPLTLGDLADADAEIMEKTLVDLPMSLPETKVVAPASFPPEITETTLSGYTSARDAIEKLFANAPAMSTETPRPNRDSNSMDMEATLSALENTLGGTLPPAATITKGDSPTASGMSEEDLSGPSSSTLRLSQADLLSAIGATPAARTSPAQEPTVALRASDLLPASGMRPEGVSRPASPRSFAPLSDAPDAGAELLRLKIGEEIYGGLTMSQLIAWVEEGRILENHLVARQHSENWLEAHKVPGLRPVFERLRRERSGGAPSLDSGISESATKKSLFGGLFGKN